jgi:hypothetical protein
MSSTLWTMLLCFGCFFCFFLMSCLYISLYNAEQADEKKEQIELRPVHSWISQQLHNIEIAEYNRNSSRKKAASSKNADFETV